MGIEYSAVLFYGFPLPDDIELRILDGFDGCWETWLAETLGVPPFTPQYKETATELGCTIARVDFFSESTLYLAISDSYILAGYDPEPIDLPTVSDELLKVVAQKLGIKYAKPSWYLAVDVM